MRPLLFGLAFAASVSMAAGCVIVTGSTEGYSSADGGGSGAGCSSATACSGGQVCCLDFTESTTSATGSCQATCTAQSPQLCATTGECKDDGGCYKQSCTIDAGGASITVPLQACGLIPQCSVQ